MKDYEFIDVIKAQDGVAVVSLNRPKALNALNKAMILELDRAFDEMVNDSLVRVVVITGEKNFAAGADISNMLTLSPEQAKEFSFRHTFNKIENFPKPVIAVLSGFVLGGGLELALSCDMRIASPDIKLGFPEINLGIFPGAGGTQRLPRLIGSARAKELIFLGNAINVTKAAKYGLVTLVTENPLAEALKLAGELAAKPPVALKLAKQCINLAFDVEQRTGIEFEAVAWSSTFATEDQRAGMKAFTEKRKVVFTGN